MNDIILAYVMANPSVTSISLNELGHILTSATRKRYSSVELSNIGAACPYFEALTIVNGYETGWRVVLG